MLGSIVSLVSSFLYFIKDDWVFLIIFVHSNSRCLKITNMSHYVASLVKFCLQICLQNDYIVFESQRMYQSEKAESLKFRGKSLIIVSVSIFMLIHFTTKCSKSVKISNFVSGPT